MRRMRRRRAVAMGVTVVVMAVPVMAVVLSKVLGMGVNHGESVIL